jgi:hypothetical protein
MTDKERAVWTALRNVVADSIKTAPAGRAIAEINALLEDDADEPDADEPLNAFPPPGFICEVCDERKHWTTAYSNGRGGFAMWARHVGSENAMWYYWQPAGLPEDAKPGETFVYERDGEVCRFNTRDECIDWTRPESIRYIYTVPSERGGKR